MPEPTIDDAHDNDGPDVEEEPVASPDCGGASSEETGVRRTKHVILDYPGFEGHAISHEKAVKLKFLRPGSKEAVRMLRVQNRLKSGTHAVPLVIEEERAAGVQANVDMLLLLGKSAECSTAVAFMPQYFNVDNGKGLIHCSLAELKDPKATIDGFILYGLENPTDMDKIWFDPNRQGLAVSKVPAIHTREVNPEISSTDVGKPVWEMMIDDVQVMLDLHYHTAATPAPFRLPVSPTGNFPYRGSDGEVLFIVSGTESGDPETARPRSKADADEDVACDLCSMIVKVKNMRHHVAAHLLFDSDWLVGDRPLFPCGLCGTRSVEPFTSASSMVVGCPTALSTSGTPKHIGVCKLVGTPNYSLKPALTSSDRGPSTNVPHKCPECQPKPGVFVYKYSMAKHYELEHPGHKVPAELSEIGSAEKERLKKEWGKIEKKRATKRSA